MTSEISHSNIFKPIVINKDVILQHRIVIPPLTRLRATYDNIPTDIMLEHYESLSITPGSLIITEALSINKEGPGRPRAPGVWKDQQIKAWKLINAKVHENGSFMSAQIWGLGRKTDISELTKHGYPYQSASDIYINDEDKKIAESLGNNLKALTIPEIQQWVKDFTNGAIKAIKEADFDIVEIHSAHGYLIDQFFQSISNNRTDEYGGSIENRARFFFEIVDSIIEALDGDGSKLACRLSPWATAAGMAGIDGDPHPIATYGYVISEIEKRRKKHGWAYLSIVEPRTNGNITKEEKDIKGDNRWIFDIFQGTVLRSGDYYNYKVDKEEERVKHIVRDVNRNDKTLIGIGRPSVSNPDLVEKLRNGIPLTPYDRSSFYLNVNYGYNTFPRHGEVLKFDKEEELKRYGVPLA